jgi:predicted deacylase
MSGIEQHATPAFPAARQLPVACALLVLTMVAACGDAQRGGPAPQPPAAKPPAAAPGAPPAGAAGTPAEATGDAGTRAASPLVRPPAAVAAGTPEGLALLGQVVPPGTSQRLTWEGGGGFDSGSAEGIPVLVVNGSAPGPLVCLTAAIHGDELNGIEMVRRIMQDLDPGRLKGGVIGIPIVNLQGFRRGSRYLPDRRDLNRFFPGNPSGSAASRIANSLFTEVIRHCNGLVDIHTGSLNRTNLPQLRADLRNAGVREFADGFGGLVVVQSPGVPGTLRRAATDRNVPAVTMEAGEPGRLQSVEVRIGVDAILRMFERLGMLDKLRLMKEPKPVYYRSTWVRANDAGILFSLVRLGQVVSAGDILGTVTDPITNEQSLIYSPVRGRVVGMALNQVVMPGFATFNLGIEANRGNGSLMESLVAPPEEESEEDQDLADSEEQERPE